MAWQESVDAGGLMPSSYRDRVVDVLEELYRTTLLLRGRSEYLVERFSEAKQRKEQGKLTPGRGVSSKE